MAPFTWFRVGGPAEVLFLPADDDDLAAFLAALPPDVPVYAVGVGSNVIVRDGGVPGVVIRLSRRGFGEAGPQGDTVRAGRPPSTARGGGRGGGASPAWNSTPASRARSAAPCP